MPRTTYANVTATLALVVALGGSAVAAAPLITGADVRNGSLTGQDVKDLSLTPKDFRGSVRGPAGPAGAAGADGTDAAAPVRTVLPVAGKRNGIVTSWSTASIGTFVKQSAATRVDLSYATDLDPTDGCRVQLRIDGLSSTGLASADSGTNTTPGDARVFGADPVPAFVTASFTSLPAGTHTVDIAVASGSGATTCEENDSGILRAVVVDEVAVP